MGMALGVAACGLAGCGDSELSAEELEDRVGEFSDASDRVDALDRTSSAVVEATPGAATYQGYTGLGNPDQGQSDVALVGETTLRVDFGADTISGRADDFIGTVDGGRTQEYDGSLVLSDGRLGVLTANSISAGMSGTLTGDGNTVELVDADLLGQFVGRSAQGLEMVDPDAVVRVNGDREDVSVAVIGER